MRAGKIRPYVFYVIAFSLICSLASELKTALSMWSWGFSTWSISSISRIFFNLPGYVLIVVLQVVAAVVTIKALSLRKLFYLSCVFTIVDVLIVGLHRQMMEPAGSFFFPLFLIGQLLPYVAPIVILALIGRKKGVTELTENVGGGAVPSCVESEEATDSDTRGQLKALYEGYWYFFDILLVVVVYLYGTLNDPFRIIMYVCGLCNRLELRAYMMFMWVIWLVPAALCGVVLLLRMIVSWPKRIERKTKLLLLRLLVVVGLGGYLVLPFIPVRPPGMNIYIKGFRHYIEGKVDITGIRSWLATLGPENCVVYDITLSGGRKASSPKYLQKYEWPEVVGKLKPRYVRLSLDYDKRPMVRLDWGSGFLGSWGIVVGSETMPMPESDLSPHGEYRQEIGNGVYIWYGMD